jgi:uncharacterized protein
MKQAIGQPARKERFFKRPDVRMEILNAIKNEENILISAPRRVGKTSILLNLVDEPDLDVFAVYLNTEAVEEPEMFFQNILKCILNTDRIEGFGKFSKKAKELLTGWANKIAGINIGGVGIELREKERVNFYDQLVEFLSEINLDDKRIVVLIDEFPITIEHIHRKYGLDGVKHFLNQNRSLRQNPVFQEKVKFIYSGSIGLFTVVKRLKATDRINDLKEIKITALKNTDAKEFINELLLEKVGLKAENDLLEYLLSKIEWWIPFYFQLLVKDMSDLINYDNEALDEKTVDTSFEKVVENGNIYFEHFKSRLSKTFENKELDFVLELLLALKKENTLSYNEIINIAEGLEIRTQADDILEILKYDGYIVQEKNIFKFYSPILKRWWK